MNPTLEVRWFLPAEAHPRPATFEAAPSPETRTDWYARSHPNCGIKLRAGNLDVKLLEADLGIRDLAGFRGRLQRWRKWIYDGEHVDDPSSELLRRNGWTPVTKTRSLLVFAVSPAGIEPASDWPVNGCQFEWTEVAVGDTKMLTIGLECFGNEDLFESGLIKTAERILPELPEEISYEVNWEEMSMSYPAWLETISAG